MRTLRDLIAEIYVFTSSLSGLGTSDFAGWLADRRSIASLTMRDVYYICLGRLPEDANAATSRYASSAACAAHIVECLVSSEFRLRLPEILFAAYPELERHFFVHIPRTGGTALRKLTERYHAVLSWNESYVQEDWFKYDEPTLGDRGLSFMLRFLAQFGRKDPPTFFYTGHVTIASLLGRNLIRPHDQSVAVLRDPVEMLISTVNYIFTMASGPVRTPDAMGWAEWLCELEPSWRPGVPPDARLIQRLIRSDRFRSDYSNMMTRYLSVDGTIEGAMEGVTISQCQLIGLDQIGSYSSSVLGIIEPISRLNASEDVMGNIAGYSSRIVRYINEELVRSDIELLNRLKKAGIYSPTT